MNPAMTSTDASSAIRASTSRSVTTAATTTTATSTGVQRGTQESQNVAPSSDSRPGSHSRNASARKTATRGTDDACRENDVVPREHAGSSSSSSHTTTSSYTHSRNEQPHQQDNNGTTNSGGEQHTHNQRTSTTQEDVKENNSSHVPSRQAATTTATAVPPSVKQRQDQDTMGSQTSSSPPSPLSQRQQHQQQRQEPPAPATLYTAPTHSVADVARVRAALADAGYPNPSWNDIKRVFEQMARTQATAETQQASTHQFSRYGSEEEENDPPIYATNSNAVDELGYTYPSSPSQHPPHSATMLSHDKCGLLHYLDPSLRLERYIQLRERELENMCLRPTRTTTTMAAAPINSQHSTAHRSVKHEYEIASSAAVGTQPDALQRLSSTNHPAKAAATGSPATAAAATRERREGGIRSSSKNRHSQQSAAVAAMAAQHRRAANIVFNITGDQRFRFFPTTRTPQGSGALTALPATRTTITSATAKAAGATNTAVSHAGRGDASGCGEEKGEMGANVATALSPSAHRTASTAVVPLTPCRNFFNPERVAHSVNKGGGVGSRSRFDGYAAHSAARPSVLSSSSVSYLDPQGRTLRRKADPVKRGQQMRVLWAKDNFLSQRRRPQEAWRTRQITMAYGQEAVNQ